MTTTKIIFRLLVLCFVLFLGCSSTKINVFSTQSPKSNIQELKTFGIARINADDPETEKEVLSIIRKNLEAKGLGYVNKNYDFLVAVHFYVGAREEYIPPTTLKLRDINPDRSGRRENDSRKTDIRRTEADGLSSSLKKNTLTFNGYIDISYYHNIKVYFLQLPSKETVYIVWRGEVESQNKKKDILEIAPNLLSELLTEFPNPTDKPETRKIHL